MSDRRAISRRSFLQRVGGGVAVAGSATLLTGCVGIADSDPYDPIGGRGGHGGYGGPGRYPPPPRECTDNDSGRYADPRGRGRRCRQQPQSCTDADQGRNEDEAGQGRCRR